jgi:hypothetical protein
MAPTPYQDRKFFWVKNLGFFKVMEAALLPRNLSSVSVRTFVISLYYDSGSAKAKIYGSYGSGPGSGSATLCNTLCFFFRSAAVLSFHVHTSEAILS